MFPLSGDALRDWFAGFALLAIINKTPRQRVPASVSGSDDLEVARGAYAYADAMITARGLPRGAE
jgi:hypothetical protein